MENTDWQDSGEALEGNKFSIGENETEILSLKTCRVGFQRGRGHLRSWRIAKKGKGRRRKRGLKISCDLKGGGK